MNKSESKEESRNTLKLQADPKAGNELRDKMQKIANGLRLVIPTEAANPKVNKKEEMQVALLCC